jgi:hypothetical protein
MAGLPSSLLDNPDGILLHSAAPFWWLNTGTLKYLKFTKLDVQVKLDV